ncbi:dihydrolipoyl dehydrogenase [Nitzschia inconspicua]|uniref:Lipoamide acyltransferase component of branched-chain alpha-keto acid dehydrogenase complex, mitochondrial n=1 Tax=Nitzschia inconspicua TaxID=303405 RepID=A0A9K3PG92_9STRA|nr:dihydrolipoyl dehydrogenase [Nitzschia inconspicua]
MLSKVMKRSMPAVIAKSRTLLSRNTTTIYRGTMRLPSALPTVSSQSFVSVTIPLWEKHTMKVPTMGDSITEGTIVEWTVQVGQAVKEEDVVALIETDKVTVDIKATKAGVVTKQYGAVDDTVEVGANLCEIDTEATATVEASESNSPTETLSGAEATAAAAAPTPAPAIVSAADTTSISAPSTQQHGARTPSIKFLGKEGWARVLSGGGSATHVVYNIPANYGRLSFSEEEMEALIMGGANIAPEVKDYSSGATFKM